MWQSASPEGANTGWGGRIGDLLQSANGHPSFTCVNTSGHAIYLCGKDAAQFHVNSNGSVPLSAAQAPLFGSATASATLRQLVTETRSHLLENDYNRISKRAIDANESLGAALSASSPLSVAFPAHNGFADQLKLVARMIGAAPRLGVRRQVFMVALGDFDNHNNMATHHPVLMAKLGEALSAFFAATVELGVSDSVTTFTASEFGRSLSGNPHGSEHGWGSMHLVMGGAVKGQRFYGRAPVVASDGPDDLGQGRLIPTTSVEQLAATMGSWLGVSDAELLAMLPHLAHFNASERKLGFL